MNLKGKSRRLPSINPAKLVDIVDALKLKGERTSEFQKRLSSRLEKAGDVDEPDIYFSLWDFAGQSVYYITHQVCMTQVLILT